MLRFPTLTPPSVPPVGVDDSATVEEDSDPTPIDVLANDTDGGDGGTMTIESVTQPTNGSVTITGGGSGLTYEPEPTTAPAARLQMTSPTP